MHIGLYCPSWPPSKAANGIVTYVDGLREGLRRLGHRVTIVTARKDSAHEDGDVFVVQLDRESRLIRAVKMLFLGDECLRNAFAEAMRFGNVCTSMTFSEATVSNCATLPACVCCCVF